MWFLNCYWQKQLLEVYSYPAEVPGGTLNCQVQEADFLLIHWTEGSYNNNIKWESKENQRVPTTKVQLAILTTRFFYIFTTLVRFAISGGIGPVNWFAPKSKTWRYCSMPSSFGIIPIRLLPCKILQNIKRKQKIKL